METINFKYFKHYSEVPESFWKWPNFTPKEIASKGDGSIIIHFRSLDCLQFARTLAKKPFHINSGYRDPLYNARVGGGLESMHMKGQAFDISLAGFDKTELHQILLKAGFTGFGLHYKTFIHADTGRPRTW